MPVTPTISLTPEPARWKGLVRGVRPGAAEFRGQMGLPTTGWVILSGHQAGFWHPGILAKHLAASAFAKAVGGKGAWVVVDQDASEVSRIRYPRKDAQAPLGLGEGVWEAAPKELAAQQKADCALAGIPAFAPHAPPDDGATPDVQRGLRAMHECLSRHGQSSSAAVQLARANADLLATMGEALPLVMATRLNKTGAFRSLLEKMAEDPDACGAAYNRAVEAHGHHGVTPLAAGELPLWRIGTAGKPTPRRRMYGRLLEDCPIDQMAPRAVLMTGLLRWLGCDLFIHGTGGGASEGDEGYDRIAEAWFKAWLGVDLAPSVVATATALLPLGVEPAADQNGVVGPHKAKHTPALIGDARRQQEKDRLVAEIAGTTDRAAKHALYRQLHGVLEAAAAEHGAELTAISRAAAAQAARHEAEALLRDRTWAWPLYPRPVLVGVKNQIEKAFAGATP